MNAPKNPYLDEELLETFTPNQNQDVRWLFDTEKSFWSLKAHLQGGRLFKNPDGNFELRRQRGKESPYMNQYGIDQTMANLYGFVTLSSATTVYDESRILTLLLDLHERLAILYATNMDLFSLTPAKASVVLGMIMTEVESNLRRSTNAATLKMIGGTERVVESRAQQNTGGAMGRLLG